MKPIGKYIIAKHITLNEATTWAGTFQMTAVDTSKMLYQQAEVLEIGPEVEVVQPGDRILYNKSSGHDLTLNGETVRILQERPGDVVAILEDTDRIG